MTFINSPHKRIEVTIYLLSIFGSMCQGRVGKHRVQRHEPCLHGDNKRQNFLSFCRGSDKSLISEGLLTVHKDADYMNAAAEAGGSAYVVKSRLSLDLLPAIRAVLSNKLFVSASLMSESG
ncbi:MAG: hypothetical protein WBZ01_10980 [Terriglobales bacterium]